MSKEFQIRYGNLIASFDLENEDGDIDFCKLLKVSHGVADEIGMFVDYVATNKIIKDQSKQIADLEAKLAEKDKEIEKITRIVAYKDDMDRSTTINGVKFTNEQIITLQNIDYFADKHNQDKISFAITELEKVKEFCNQREKDFTYLRDDIKAISHNKWVDYIEELRFIKAHIDNQINGLKGEK